MIRTVRTSLVAALLAGAASSGLAAQATISTEPVATSGIGTTANTGGQTFVVPDADNTVLQSFRVGFDTPNGPRQYVARLSQWLPGTMQLAGPTLFQSAVGTTTGAPSPWTYVTFDVGGIALDPAATYIFFLSFAGSGGVDFASSGLDTNVNPYPAGSTFLADGSLFASADVATTWIEPFSVYGGVDLGFTAEFAPNSTVPEPASLALLGTGLAGLLGARRRRRRRGDAQG